MPNSITRFKGMRVTIFLCMIRMACFWCPKSQHAGASLSPGIVPRCYFTESETTVSRLIFFFICYLRESPKGTSIFQRSKRWVSWNYLGNYQQVQFCHRWAWILEAEARGRSERNSGHLWRRGRRELRVSVTGGKTMFISKASNLYLVKCSVREHSVSV